MYVCGVWSVEECLYEVWSVEECRLASGEGGDGAKYMVNM